MVGRASAAAESHSRERLGQPIRLFNGKNTQRWWFNKPEAANTWSVKNGVLISTTSGMIGIGMQGSVLLREAVAIPGVKCVAACDLYDERHVLAKEIAGANVSTTRAYHDLLQRKDIDCVVVAVPDHWHKQILIDAVRAGKDVYCEKPMSHSIAEGAEMVKAVQATSRIVQIGSQSVSSPIYAKAKEMQCSAIMRLPHAIWRISPIEPTRRL